MFDKILDQGVDGKVTIGNIISIMPVKNGLDVKCIII
mgnify:CR=1 FL=1